MFVINDTPIADLSNLVELVESDFMRQRNPSTGREGVVAHIAPRPCQKYRGKPLLFTISVLGSLLCIYTKNLHLYVRTEGRSNNGKKSCLKTQCHDQDSNPHSADQKTRA